MVHGFTSSGILESQYQGFAEAAKIGNVGDKYIDNGEALTLLISWTSFVLFLLNDKCPIQILRAWDNIPHISFPWNGYIIAVS